MEAPEIGATVIYSFGGIVGAGNVVEIYAVVRPSEAADAVRIPLKDVRQVDPRWPMVDSDWVYEQLGLPTKRAEVEATIP